MQIEKITLLYLAAAFYYDVSWPSDACNLKNGRRRKWYEELREQRTRDIETEML
jgi:hypothetical protein